MGSGGHEIGLYRDASVYDIVHTPGTSGEVDGLLRISGLFVRSRRRFRALEPACGTGRYLRVLGSRGMRCAGFDLSEEMVGYARRWISRRGLGGVVDVRVGSMTDFVGELGEGRYTFAFNLINTVRHLGSDPEMLAHFDQVARALVPGGVYALGLSTSAPGLEMESEDVWTARRGNVGVVQALQYIPPEAGGARRERVISQIRVTTPGGARDLGSVYDLRTYSHAQWHDLVARSSLRIRCVVNEIGDEIDAPECGYAVYVMERA